MRFRMADANDAGSIKDLFHRSFTATFGHLYPPDDLAHFLAGCSEGRFRNECRDPAFAIFVAEDAKGKLCGYCTLGPQDLGIQSERRWCVLRQLYLEEDAKGTGLADQLMDMALAEARARDFQELYLTVWVDNHRARRFYTRRGFIEVGAYAFKVGNRIDDDRILKLSL